MPIYKVESEGLKQLDKTTFTAEKINEARDLQKLIINSLDEIEKDLFLLSSEFGYWEDSKRRIDLLCLDKNANLVVIELKRTVDGGHMELQAIRYAAMVSNMTFENAVKVRQEYMSRLGKDHDEVEQEILDFLEWDNHESGSFANDVRIILVSADFSKEITSSVLWLNSRDLDIKCVRMVPQKDGNTLYLDIQQIIPLPEAVDYQVKLRAKEIEQRQVARSTSRDYTKYDLQINGQAYFSRNKRQTMYQTISNSVVAGIKIADLQEITGEERWLSVDKICLNQEEFEREIQKINPRYDSKRWFNADDQLIHEGGKTYVFSNQYGKSTYRLVSEIIQKFPQLKGSITASII